LDRVSQQVLALDGKGTAELFADFDQWEWHQKERASRPAKKTAGASAQAPVAPKEGPKKELSTRERDELKGMEAAIHKAEAQVKKAQDALADPAIATDAAELIKRQKKVDEAQAAVATLFARWEALEAKRGVEA
jgi:ATP-binding cassette subfamily F protein uup